MYYPTQPAVDNEIQPHVQTLKSRADDTASSPTSLPGQYRWTTVSRNTHWPFSSLIPSDQNCSPATSGQRRRGVKTVGREFTQWRTKTCPTYSNKEFKDERPRLRRLKTLIAPFYNLTTGRRRQKFSSTGRWILTAVY